MRAATGLVILVVIAALTTTTGSAQSLPDIIARAKPAVAIVLAQTRGGVSQGSAFVYDSRGFLLTAAHVVEDAREVIVRLPGRRPLLAIVAQQSRNLDVAALRVAEEGLPSIPLASIRPRVGEEIIVLGYPLAREVDFEDLTATRGIVSRILLDQGLLQFDASVNPGNSGGPVLNSRGEAVGIVVGRIRGATGINFAVMTEVAQDVARLALQVPFAPTTPSDMQTPAPAPSPPISIPMPAVTPAPNEWVLIGSKGPTPRNTQIRTPVNLAIREARYKRADSMLHVQVELYERPTGDAELALYWRLAGAEQPSWGLRYFFATRRWVFGRYVIVDQVRKLANLEPVQLPGIRVVVTGRVVDIALPMEGLRPLNAEWEILVRTAYRAPDEVYHPVDWLAWTRINW